MTSIVEFTRLAENAPTAATMHCIVQGSIIVAFTRLAENAPTAAMMHCTVQGRSIGFMQRNTTTTVEFTRHLSPFQVTSTSRW